MQDKWFNQNPDKVNDSVVRVGIVEGEYHLAQARQRKMSFFFVLQGKLFVDLEEQNL